MHYYTNTVCITFSRGLFIGDGHFWFPTAKWLDVFFVSSTWLWIKIKKKIKILQLVISNMVAEDYLITL